MGVFYPPINYYGGSVVVTIYVVNALVESGHDVVLYVDNVVRNREIEEMIGDPISSAGKIVVQHTMFKPKQLFEMHRNSFKSLLLKRKCDILIDTYSNFSFPWTDISYIHFPYLNEHLFKPNFPYLRRKSVFHAANIPYIFFEKNLSSYKKKLIIANSYFTAKYLKRYLSINPKVVYPPIASIFFRNKTLRRQIRKNLVVTVARINPDKRMETLPDIARQTSEKIHFAILGFIHDKSTYDMILAKIRKFKLSDRVKIVTDLSKSEIMDWLRKAKVYLHPPIIEHFGISIAEAMSLGCVPIVYDSGGVQEFVPSEYRYRSLEEAAEKVEKAVINWSSGDSETMIKIAQRFSEENFRREFSKVFSRYADAYVV